MHAGSLRTLDKFAMSINMVCKCLQDLDRFCCIPCKDGRRSRSPGLGPFYQEKEHPVLSNMVIFWWYSCSRHILHSARCADQYSMFSEVQKLHWQVDSLIFVFSIVLLLFCVIILIGFTRDLLVQQLAKPSPVRTCRRRWGRQIFIRLDYFAMTFPDLPWRLQLRRMIIRDCLKVASSHETFKYAKIFRIMHIRWKTSWLQDASETKNRSISQRGWWSGGGSQPVAIPP
jgi:hypothetical protein